MTSKELAVDPVVLREEVKTKYREVALNPSGEYHFHTGRPLARRLGYDPALFESMPDAAVESFAGVANPFSLRSLEQAKGLSMPDQVEGLTALSLHSKSGQRPSCWRGHATADARESPQHRRVHEAQKRRVS
jgi:hypothetical protein